MARSSDQKDIPKAPDAKGDAISQMMHDVAEVEGDTAKKIADLVDAAVDKMLERTLVAPDKIKKEEEVNDIAKKVTNILISPMEKDEKNALVKHAKELIQRYIDAPNVKTKFKVNKSTFYKVGQLEHLKKYEALFGSFFSLNGNEIANGLVDLRKLIKEIVPDNELTGTINYGVCDVNELHNYIMKRIQWTLDHPGGNRYPQYIEPHTEYYQTLKAKSDDIITHHIAKWLAKHPEFKSPQDAAEAAYNGIPALKVANKAVEDQIKKGIAQYVSLKQKDNNAKCTSGSLIDIYQLALLAPMPVAVKPNAAKRNQVIAQHLQTSQPHVVKPQEIKSLKSKMKKKSKSVAHLGQSFSPVESFKSGYELGLNSEMGRDVPLPPANTEIQEYDAGFKAGQSYKLGYTVGSSKEAKVAEVKGTIKESYDAGFDAAQKHKPMSTDYKAAWKNYVTSKHHIKQVKTVIFNRDDFNNYFQRLKKDFDKLKPIYEELKNINGHALTNDQAYKLYSVSFTEEQKAKKDVQVSQGDFVKYLKRLQRKFDTQKEQFFKLSHKADKDITEEDAMALYIAEGRNDAHLRRRSQSMPKLIIDQLPSPGHQRIASRTLQRIVDTHEVHEAIDLYRKSGKDVEGKQNAEVPESAFVHIPDNEAEGGVLSYDKNNPPTFIPTSDDVVAQSNQSEGKSLERHGIFSKKTPTNGAESQPTPASHHIPGSKTGK